MWSVDTSRWSCVNVTPSSPGSTSPSTVCTLPSILNAAIVCLLAPLSFFVPFVDPYFRPRILAHLSRSVTVRLNTGAPGSESSVSTQK